MVTYKIILAVAGSGYDTYKHKSLADAIAEIWSGIGANTIELGGFSSAWLRDLAFYAGLEVKGDSR